MSYLESANKRRDMKNKFDINEPATDSEAAQAIKSGLTPAQVRLAILTGSRADTAKRYGFERNAIARLALRWGIEL